MNEHKPLPVSGYTPQSDEKVALVNEFKQDEERLLRKIDAAKEAVSKARADAIGSLTNPFWIMTFDPPFDPKWLAKAQEHFEMGFMALNRAVFKPKRIGLPEDESGTA